MKKAIKIAYLASLVLVARLACTQTVASNSNGLFLQDSIHSNKAQTYIDATRTDLQTKTAATSYNTGKLKQQKASESSNISKNQNTDSDVAFVASNASSPIDEGSLPLFTKLQASNTQSIPQRIDDFGTSFSLVITIFGLIVVLMASSWFLQKKGVFSANNFGKVLGIVPLDNKRLIYIVDVMGKVMVLGVTETNINFLTEITDKDTIDAYRLKYGQAVTPGLEKLFPFIKSPDKNENNELEEDQKETAEKKIESVKAELDNNKKIRNTRLQNMLIKK